MTRYFLGVDVGGTKTHALVADEAGRALGFGESGPGNHEGVGYAGLQAVVGAATGQALGQAGLTMDELAGAGLGIGGYDWPSQREPHLRALAEAGLRMPLEIVNDAVIGLLAGASEGWGVGVAAGTSCNCWGRDRQGRYGRVVGMGSIVGENGGAAELVHEAIKAVAYEWVRRGPSTGLTQTFVALTGAQDAFDFLEGITTGRLSMGAEAAPLVFSLAAEGDAVAGEVIRWAGRELAGLAHGVIRQLGFEHLEFEVVLSGSLYQGGALLIDPMRADIHAVAPGARLVRLTAPPVVGGVVLALAQSGLEARAARERLIETTNAMMRHA